MLARSTLARALASSLTAASLSFAACGDEPTRQPPPDVLADAPDAADPDAADPDAADPDATDPDAAADTASPAPPLADRYVLTGDDLFPEGGAFDPVDRAFFVSSASHGTVTRVAADGTESVLFAPDEAGWLTMGLRVDADRRRLWACAIREGTLYGSLWGFDLSTGQRTHDVPLASAFAEASCNDVLADPSGHVYVTDRENPHIYRVDPETSVVTLWASDPALGADATIGMNGIALTEDGATLLVSLYMPATIVRVDVADPTQVSPVALTGDDFLGTELITGADGVRMDGDTLLVTLSDRLARLSPADATWSSATVATQPILGGTSAVILAEGHIYGVKSEIVAFVLGGDLRLPFEIHRIAPAPGQ